MASEEVSRLIESLGVKDNLTVFELLSSGRACECKIAEKLGIEKSDVGKKLQPLVDAGTIVHTVEEGRNIYSVNETAVCLLNKYFNDIIYRCRSVGLKCKCGSGNC